MIRPARFESNPHTAESNRFQGRHHGTPAEQQAAAAREFDALAQTLEQAGIHVIVINDTPEPHTPDSVFPNNWISLHADSSVVLYPMEAPNRRTERRRDILRALEEDHGFDVGRVVDLSSHEDRGHFLEGTGSLVLDRVNHVAYACLSSRTHTTVLDDFAEKLNYRVVAFDAIGRDGAAIYHTNVMMNVGEEVAVICSESIRNVAQRNEVLESLRETGHAIVNLTYDQMEAFAGNMLELRSSHGDRIIAMSQQARDSLRPEQVEVISNSSRIVSSPIDNIESSAGGSVRCMLAEIHLPLRA